MPYDIRLLLTSGWLIETTRILACASEREMGVTSLISAGRMGMTGSSPGGLTRSAHHHDTRHGSNRAAYPAAAQHCTRKLANADSGRNQ